MAKKQEKNFTGFTRETFAFFRQLKKHNNKAWFESHREIYENHVLGPLRNLVTDMGEFMLTIDPNFEIRPAVNKTISRIYRDTRFSSDKTLFKKGMWISFGRPSLDWKDDPVFFFEISGTFYRYGMGFYSASAQTMAKFRELIDENPRRASKLITYYSKQKVFELDGEKYKRILDKNKPEKIQQWYQFKSLYLMTTRKIEKRLFRPELAEELKTDFKVAVPMYNFLREAKNRVPGHEAASEEVHFKILRKRRK